MVDRRNRPEVDVHPVVIIGGGLAGSAAAAFLGQAGVPALVLERHDDPTERPRAWIVSSRSLELFRGLGADDQVRTRGTAGAWDLQVVDTLLDVPGGQSVFDDTADVSPTGSAMCDQDIQESVLRDYAAAHGSTVSWGQTATAVVDRGDVVEVQRESGPPLLARYVIVADGSRAALLPQLGITSTVPDGNVVGDFDQVLFRSAALDELMAARPGKMFYCPPSNTIVFRRDLGRWQVQRQDGQFDDIEAEIAATVGQRVDVEVLDHSRWQPAAQLADRMRTGNVFLVGDAAHSMPPSLGMAGNLAIADAHNLAWKLAWVLDGKAGPELLDSYEAERRPVDELVLHQSLARTHDEPTLDQAVIELGLGYPAGLSSALHGDGDDLVTVDPHSLTPTVGVRIPHQWLPDGRSTLDLPESATFISVGTAAEAEARLPFQQISIGGPDADPSQVWIVRPDGHVAAHIHPSEIDTVLDEILHRTR